MYEPQNLEELANRVASYFAYYSDLTFQQRYDSILEALRKAQALPTQKQT